MTWTALHSEADASVNHAHSAADGGLWEARYVQRVPDYFISYLSSHTGCNQSCRFCHLTATGQTWMTPAVLAGYLEQNARVLTTYTERRAQGLPEVQHAHVNFMARGEPLSNPFLCEQSSVLYAGLAEQFAGVGIQDVRFKVSTIVPRDFPTNTPSLIQALDDPRAMLYYSLYSMNPQFRKRWLPKAKPAEEALDLIADYQQHTQRPVALHWSFIKGANDTHEDIDAILEAVLSRGIRAKFNLVRYNPYSERLGEEPEECRLQALFDHLAQGLEQPGSRIVPRVGFDVKASCGMFLDQGRA